MREILFRGKSLDNGEWVYGMLVIRHDKTRHDIYQHVSQISTTYAIVDPNTVGQFTGLLDKNGNKIFEGDIVKSKYNQINEIKFGEFVDTKSHDQVGFYQVYLKDDTWDGVSSGNMDYVKDSEIIGNIHDNGELYREIKGEIK